MVGIWGKSVSSSRERSFDVKFAMEDPRTQDFRPLKRYSVHTPGVSTWGKSIIVTRSEKRFYVQFGMQVPWRMYGSLRLRFGRYRLRGMGNENIGFTREDHLILLM